MANSDKKTTILYVSLNRDDDDFVDNLRLERVKQEKRHFTKTEVAKDLIMLGIEVVKGRYLKLDQSIDEFVSKLQDMKIEMGGNTITIKKSKEQVYHMIIEKGLQHLND